MYYLSSSGLECKVEKQATIDAKNYVTSESYVNAKIITKSSIIFEISMRYHSSLNYAQRPHPANVVSANVTKTSFCEAVVTSHA